MNRKLLAGILIALILCVGLALPSTALATEADTFDPDAIGNLTISYVYDEDIPLVHLEVSLYLVATIAEDGTLLRTDDFADFDLLAYNLDSTSGLSEVHSALDHYISLHNLSADHLSVTDYTGRTDVSLAAGVYYVNTDPVFEATPEEEEGYNAKGYYTESFLVSVGEYDPETGAYIFDYVSLPKISIVGVTYDNGSFTHDITIQKIWENTENVTLPDSIEVALRVAV